jgi:hypothetical protein
MKWLAESETSINVLERNFGDTSDVTNLRTHLGARKVTLTISKRFMQPQLPYARRATQK